MFLISPAFTEPKRCPTPRISQGEDPVLQHSWVRLGNCGCLVDTMQVLEELSMTYGSTNLLLIYGPGRVGINSVGRKVSMESKEWRTRLINQEQERSLSHGRIAMAIFGSLEGVIL